jgi:Protein of unknown function (DUF2530).
VVDMGDQHPQAQPEEGPHPEVSAIDRVRLDPRLRTRDDSGISAITIGTVAWAVAWLVLTFGFPDTPQSWRAVSAAGFVLGLIGGVLLALRHRRITRRHGQE